MDYKTSGVDVAAGRNFVDQIKNNVESTYRKEVIGGLGGFGGLIKIPQGYSKPILVAGTDGVGTKLELAQTHQKHFGVGIDLVAMCVNDVITSGAQPLFFLDYIATGSLSPINLSNVIAGIAEGCKSSGCALLGGETAEMPGFYPKGRYDLAGFCVAVVEEDALISGGSIRDGDQIIGIESSGLHSNGFSLVRQVLNQSDANQNKFIYQDEKALIDELLKPTSIYVELVESLLGADIPIHGMSHITGGGLPENLPRCLPKGLTAEVDPKSWNRPKVFNWLQKVGAIPEIDLWNTFNLGVGFCLVLPKEVTDRTIELCSEIGFESWIMGRVQESSANKGKGLLGLPE
tara:strand:- start:216 stop:1253 length:1038 start_codon:yes stop_codon:yes gene_type:complete